MIRMAGYRRKAKVYKLRFEDEEFEGLEVKAKSVPLGTFMELTSLVEPGRAAKEQVEQVSSLFAVFADALVSWNLEDEDGAPVPATLAGIKAQEFDFVLPIVTAWMDAISGVAAPLAARSTNGSPIQEASLPMAPLSSSPEHSLTPS